MGAVVTEVSPGLGAGSSCTRGFLSPGTPEKWPHEDLEALDSQPGKNSAMEKALEILVGDKVNMT